MKDRAPHWITGKVETSAGDMTRVATALEWTDHVGTFKARTGINRMHYTVAPGLYAVGAPGAESPVLVTANYKMSFDCLRGSLAGVDAWIMVLDTKGINVWCAAGKGTFGTDEIVQRIEAVRLGEVVRHRVIVLPQLGAPGVAAHEVARRSGFRVVYGPVRARDVQAYLSAGRKATAAMRRVTFGFRERLAVVPMELVMGFKHVVIAAAVLFVLAGLGRHGYSLEASLSAGSTSALLLLAGFGGGAVVTPMLLPWLPGRAFSVKGAAVGLVIAIAYMAYRREISPGTLAWLGILPAVSAFLAMNFTGASTYTSLSGVKREMRIAVPAEIAGAALGLGLWVAGLFSGGL